MEVSSSHFSSWNPPHCTQSKSYICNQMSASLYMIQFYLLLLSLSSFKSMYCTTTTGLLEALRYAKITSILVPLHLLFHPPGALADSPDYVCSNGTVEVRSFSISLFKPAPMGPFSFTCFLHLHSTYWYYIIYSLILLIVFLTER